MHVVEAVGQCAGPEQQVQRGHLQLLPAHLPGPVLHLWDHMLSMQVSKESIVLTSKLALPQSSLLCEWI